jgi:hypothetical protein
MTKFVSRLRPTKVRRCEATTTPRFYSEPHQCPYAAIFELDGEWLCKKHADLWIRGEAQAIADLEDRLRELADAARKTARERE